MQGGGAASGRPRYDGHVQRALGLGLPPLYPCGSPDGEARLAAAVVATALEDAREGDRRARAFVTSATRLALWAGILHVPPARLAELAAAALKANPPSSRPRLPFRC